MKRSDVIKCELIGATVKVVDGDNKSLIGLQGKVIDESKNVLVLEQGKKLLKAQVTLEITINNESFIIEGKALAGRSHERVKK